MSDRFTEDAIVSLLSVRYAAPAYAFLPQAPVLKGATP